MSAYSATKGAVIALAKSAARTSPRPASSERRVARVHRSRADVGPPGRRSGGDRQPVLRHRPDRRRRADAVADPHCAGAARPTRSPGSSPSCCPTRLVLDGINVEIAGGSGSQPPAEVQLAACSDDDVSMAAADPPDWTWIFLGWPPTSIRALVQHQPGSAPRCGRRRGCHRDEPGGGTCRGGARRGTPDRPPCAPRSAGP